MNTIIIVLGLALTLYKKTWILGITMFLIGVYLKRKEDDNNA